MVQFLVHPVHAGRNLHDLVDIQISMIDDGVIVVVGYTLTERFCIRQLAFVALFVRPCAKQLNSIQDNVVHNDNRLNSSSSSIAESGRNYRNPFSHSVIGYTSTERYCTEQFAFVAL